MPSSSHVQIPDEVRVTAERSVMHAKETFSSYMKAAQGIASAIANQVTLNQGAALDISKKAMRLAERNVSSSFEFAQKLIQARDIQEVVKMQTEFVHSQMQIINEQLADLGQSHAQSIEK